MITSFADMISEGQADQTFPVVSLSLSPSLPLSLSLSLTTAVRIAQQLISLLWVNNIAVCLSTICILNIYMCELIYILHKIHI